MTNPIPPNINDFWNHFKDIERLADSASGDMKVLLSLFSNLKKVFENFAGAIRLLGENFHKEISKHFNTEERNFSYYHYLGNYLLKVSEINNDFAKKIEREIFTPYYDFSVTIDGNNHEALNKVYKTLLNIESSKAQQKKNQDNFYKLSRTAEKIQESFVKLVDENKGEEMLMKAQDKMIKIKMEAQEAGVLYRQQIATTNQWWKKLYSDYRQVFTVYDQNEDKKAGRNRETVMQLAKQLEAHYPRAHDEAPENFEARFQELDEKSTARPETFKLVTSGKLDEILQNQPGEDYVSYETKRKNDELHIAKSLEEQEYSTIAGSADETTLQFIQDYSRMFQPRGMITHSTSFASTTDQNESSISDDLTSPTLAVRSPGQDDNHKKMLTLVVNMPNRKFLIDTLVKQREPLKDTYEVKLTPKNYNRLQELLVKVLKEIIRENDYESLSQLLPLFNKYYTIKDGQNYYLYQYFRTMTLWEDSSLWSSIMRALHDRKAYEESHRQKKYQELEKEYAQPQLMGKLLSFGKQFAAALDIGKKGGLTESEIYATVLQELAFYLSRLTKNIVIASEILMRLAFDVGVDKEEIAELIYSQKREIDELVREKIKNYPVAKNKKAQVKWGRFYPVYLALDFLEPVDMLKLLTLSSSMKGNFKKKVYRTIFYRHGETITSAQRFKAWMSLLEVKNLDVSYKAMLEEYQQMSPDKALRSVEDVIQIDVLRSFNKHPTCDHKILQELLKSYAAYDKQISYCQGMNYIMGFLYINTQDPETSFKMFVAIMDRFMKGIFDEDFKQLKLYFFKFTRLLELYVPDLAEHFRNEKIEPSFFVPSWFITIFANSFQYTTKSQLLEKIWDFFVIDGMKVTFKTALLLLIEYKKELLDMKFDGILHFLSDLGKEELFTNAVYMKVVNGEIPVEQATREYKFIKNYGASMKNIHVTKQLLKTFDGDYDVMETRIGRLLNLHKKK